MMINMCTKLKICAWALSIFAISGIVQYMFIKTYNIYNPHWVDWTHQKAVVTIDLQTEQVVGPHDVDGGGKIKAPPSMAPSTAASKVGGREDGGGENQKKFLKLKFPSLEENNYHLYVGNFVSRDQVGITICT